MIYLYQINGRNKYIDDIPKVIELILNSFN